MILFLYLLVGFYCRKKQKISDSVKSGLSELLLTVMLPCMVFESFHISFSLALLRECSLALLIAVLLSGVALLLCTLLFCKAEPFVRPVLQFGLLINNSAFAGLPVIEGLFGESGLLLSSIFIIPNRIMMWTSGLSFFTADEDRRSAAKKVLFNPAVIAVYLGLLRMFFDPPFPAFLDSALQGLGNCTSPLAMILVGAGLADCGILSSFAEKRVWLLVLLRQLLLPLACLAVLRLFAVDPLTIGISVILTGMPVAANTVVFAQKFGADSELASKCVFVSTLTSLITAPLLSLLI